MLNIEKMFLIVCAFGKALAVWEFRRAKLNGVCGLVLNVQPGENSGD